ncbi:MAG: Asp-tRNA(Asn)/Glu-tRNA(Gln) amidotransferase subunit GatA [candidate division KSB1 bacterium]|nr:Asp-tRNA(Asn)/Glu-tRNA(Gln) amidotransferase subunit GatA [candidate division KSB1 bacterium]MDZ7345531.1 Asp-tRNA(Asn)/Glu-tRNA(Gln) amidotransferase subunit GatA [candidate division KSB1 bacterium]
MFNLSSDYSSQSMQFQAGKISCRETVSAYLTRIAENAELNAFITILGDAAIAQAEKVDAKIQAGNAGKLAGMVLAVKDLIAMRGAPTTCGSKILSNYYSPYDAAVIEKLAAEDVIFIGKTNLDEFGMGSSNETSFFGPVRNPHDPQRVPGGSSGGSAAAVAANLCTAALGTDTGGSIRQPAAMCGVVGLKPTYGRVSRFGLVAYASSLDQIGPITRSVDDAALLLSIIAGHDPRDSTSVDVPVDDYLSYLDRGVDKLKIGLPKEYFGPGVEQEIINAIERQVDLLKSGGAEIVEVSLPHTEYAVAAYYLIASAEASSNLARYDGARYGFRHPEAKTMQEMYIKSRSDGFGAEVKRRIMLGTYVLSAGYYDAYYRKAQQVRTLIKRDFEQAFQQVDCLLTPVSPTTAFKIGEKTGDPLQMYLSDVFTVSCNLAGLPGLSVPCGRDRNGMPIGLQLLAKPFDEGKLIAVGNYIESNNSSIRISL